MFNDEFKYRYTTIPFAIMARNHRANTMKSNLETLSHHHREFEILYVLDGEASYHINTKEYRIQKGDIVMINPYLIHRATIYADKNFEHRCLCFDLKLLYDQEMNTNFESGTYSVSPVINHAEPYSAELGEYVVNAYDNCCYKNEGWELSVIGNMSLFFSKLKKFNLITQNTLERTKKNFCYQVINYIDTNYQQNITSVHAATALFMNNSYFCRKFKKNFGFCFQKYIEVYRVEKAKILLKTTDSPISEIAVTIGFNNFSYFCKVFKENQQCTPSQYRKMVSGE